MRGIKKHFLMLKNIDEKMLSSTLETITYNNEIKDIFFKKDKQTLFNSVNQLFYQIKNNYGITHFYFILPNGDCFLRVHNEKIFNDKIERTTFKNAKTNQKLEKGIELGRTAFALRAIMPVYKDNQLLGYIELGEEINHFLSSLKNSTNKDYALYAKKKFINKENWDAVKQNSKERNNWYDLNEYLLLDSTKNEEINKIQELYFTEKNIKELEDSAFTVRIFKLNGKTFACGGFFIQDASNNNAGLLLTIFDITEETVRIRNLSLLTTKILLLMFALSSLAIFIMSKIITKPLLKIKDQAKIISEGNLDARLNFKTKDEIGELAKSIDIMVDSLKNITNNEKKARREASINAEELNKIKNGLENTVVERTKDLQNKIKKLTKSRKAMLYMIEDLNFLSKQLQASNEQIIKTEKLSTIGQLASTVAHELRNPLGVMSNILYILKKNEKCMDKDIKKNLDIISIEIKKSTKIINDLLEFSNIKKPNLKIVNINDLINVTINSFPKNKNLNFELKFDQNIPLLKLDELQIQQVLLNLITNAIQAINNSYGTITIKTFIENEIVKISIADSGIGIDKTQLQKIFEPLYTTKSRGTGLGLSLCESFIKNHGGTIKVESEKLKGSTFTISLPLKSCKYEEKSNNSVS